MNTWHAYRDAWATRPWLLTIAVLALVLIVLGIVGTVLAIPLAFVFIPGLAVLFAHHLLVDRVAGGR